MTDLFTHAEARQARDAGMARAAEHAERVDPDWPVRALVFVRFYAATHAEFLTEDVVAAYLAAGHPPPPDGRAWGPVMQAAARREIIERCGYDAARTSNLSPKVLWRACEGHGG